MSVGSLFHIISVPIGNVFENTVEEKQIRYQNSNGKKAIECPEARNESSQSKNVLIKSLMGLKRNYRL